MKSKELIRLLQEQDPTGEGEVLVANRDIYYLEWKEGYWDGCKELLVRDPKLEGKCYSIIGAEYRSDGYKLNIHTMGLEDVLLDNPDAPVKVVDTFSHKQMQEKVDKMREEMKCIYKKIEGKTNED